MVLTSTTKPSDCSSRSAPSWERPTTLGTGLVDGPLDTTTVIGWSTATVPEGSVPITRSAGWSLEGWSARLMFSARIPGPQQLGARLVERAPGHLGHGDLGRSGGDHDHHALVGTGLHPGVGILVDDRALGLAVLGRGLLRGWAAP